MAWAGCRGRRWPIPCLAPFGPSRRRKGDRWQSDSSSGSSSKTGRRPTRRRSAAPSRRGAPATRSLWELERFVWLPFETTTRINRRRFYHRLRIWGTRWSVVDAPRDSSPLGTDLERGELEGDLNTWVALVASVAFAVGSGSGSLSTGVRLDRVDCAATCAGALEPSDEPLRSRAKSSERGGQHRSTNHPTRDVRDCRGEFATQKAGLVGPVGWTRLRDSLDCTQPGRLWS